MSTESSVTVGGEIDGSRVSLRIIGGDREPSALTSTLGLTPSISYRKGDRVSSTSTGVRKCSGWIFDEPVVSRRSLGASIRALLSRLPTDSQFWTDLALDCRVDIYCAIDVRTENSGLELTADLMQQIGEKGLALQLDIYVVIDE